MLTLSWAARLSRLTRHDLTLVDTQTLRCAACGVVMKEGETEDTWQLASGELYVKESPIDYPKCSFQPEDEP